MRVFFMGTPQLAVPVLKSLIASRHEVILVVTTPDKPAGRLQKLTQSPIKMLALNEGIPIAQPATLKDETFKAQITDLKPDIGVVFAYGKIIPKWLLDLPKYGIINVHPSLLPRWRGAAPIQRAIMAGDEVTGVTIMQMAMELDAGDILLQKEIVIEPVDNAQTLTERVSEIAADLVVETIDGLEAGMITPIKQDESGVTYADKITDEDLEIDWSKPAEVIFNQVRGLNPKPGAHTRFKDLLLKVWWASVASPGLEAEKANPGTVVSIDKNRGPYISTATVPLLLEEVQPANKKRMSGAEFIRGYRLKVGDKLGGN